MTEQEKITFAEKIAKNNNIGQFVMGDGYQNCQIAYVQNASSASKADQSNPSQLPLELSTPEAKRMLDLAKNEGWLDENYQPQGLIKVQKALLAGHICDLLWGKKDWALFEKFWNERTLAGSFKDGFESGSQQIFWNKVTDVIK